MPSRKINFSLPPTNQTSAGFSPKNGTPVMKFQIGAQNGMLETSSLRLVGRYQVQSASGTYIDPTQVDYSNMGKDSDSNDVQPNSKATFSPFGGIKTCVDKVVTLSKKTSRELSTDVGYGQYVALREARFGTKPDFRNVFPSRSFSLGQNATDAQRRYNISRSGLGATALNRGQEFTMKLDIPMFQGELLHLGPDFLGGLMMSIHLSPESSFFATLMNGVTVAPAAANQIDTYRYILQDVRLEGRIQIPTPEELKAYDPVFPMDNQLNLIQDIHSSSSSNTLTPQVSMVKGIVNLFLLQSQSNNLSQSQYSFTIPPGLRSQTQAKDGERYPYKFPVDATPNYNSTNSVAKGTLVYPSLQTNISETRLQFERALTDGRLAEYSSADMVLTEEAARSQELASNGSETESSNLFVDSIGIGVDYTLGIGYSQPFINSDYNLILESGVQTSNAKLPTTFNNEPLLQQTFVRNKAFFNQQTLIKQM